MIRLGNPHVTNVVIIDLGKNHLKLADYNVRNITKSQSISPQNINYAVKTVSLSMENSGRRGLKQEA